MYYSIIQVQNIDQEQKHGLSNPEKEPQHTSPKNLLVNSITKTEKLLFPLEES